MAWSRLTASAITFAASVTIACGGGTAAPPEDSDASPTATRTAATSDVEQSPSIVSSDGLVELSVPDGALPDGITITDLSIRPVPQDDIPTTGGVAAVAAYELLPNGLQLRSPVTVDLRLTLDDLSTTLFAYHFSDDGWEPLTVHESESDPEKKTLLVTLSLSHFSYIHIFLGDDYQVSESIDFDPLTVTVAASASEVRFGESVDLTATVVAPAGGLFWSRAPNAGNLQDGVFEVTVSEQPLSLNGRFDGGALSPGLQSNLAPARVDDAPAGSALAAGSTFTVTQQFRCIGDGPAVMSYWADARVPVNVRQDFLIRGELSTANWRGEIAAYESDTASIECVMPHIVAVGAPPITTYALSPEVPIATFFAWSGADCGSVTGSTTSTMIWHHGEEGCEHYGESHPGAGITVLVKGTFPVSGKTFEMRCNYRSAASGEGAACVLNP